MSMASCVTTLSVEDVKEVKGSSWLPTQNAEPEVQAYEEDPLASVWESLAVEVRRAAGMVNVGHLPFQGSVDETGECLNLLRGVQEPILAGGYNKRISVKRGRVNSGDDVSHTGSNVVVANELEAESTSMSKPKRGRGRPRKDHGKTTLPGMDAGRY